MAWTYTIANGAWLTVWTLWAFLWRGGLSYRWTGLSLVRADGRKAARWQCALMSRVAEWQIVTVAFALRPFWHSIAAIGLPTMLPRPRITTSAPSVFTFERTSNSRTPAGVHHPSDR